MVFDNFRGAWKQAVENFWQELQSEPGEGDSRSRAMYAQVAAARHQLARLEREIHECRRGRDAERVEAEVCARRERLARDIGDADTAGIASEYRVRHEERAAVLTRKLEVLVAEHGLCKRDLEEMERAAAAVGAAPGAAELENLHLDHREREFQDLERAHRERAAAERLEELKRRNRN